MLRYIEPMKKNLKYTFACGMMVLLPLTTYAIASQIQSLDSIRSVVTTFISEQTTGYGVPPKTRIGRLGAKLRLPLCSEQIEAFQPAGSSVIGNTTIGVRCTGTSPWTIYVPAYVQLFKPVAVSSRSLTRGTPISAADIKMVRYDLATLKLGYIDDSRHIVGMVAKQHIAAGSVVTPHMVEAPRLVRRGEQVTIVARSAGIEIQATGTALADGAQGDLIKVRNSSSRKIVEAVVTDPGVVSVRTPSHSR